MHGLTCALTERNGSKTCRPTQDIARSTLWAAVAMRFMQLSSVRDAVADRSFIWIYHAKQDRDGV